MKSAIPFLAIQPREVKKTYVTIEPVHKYLGQHYSKLPKV